VTRRGPPTKRGPYLTEAREELISVMLAGPADFPRGWFYARTIAQVVKLPTKHVRDTLSGMIRAGLVEATEWEPGDSPRLYKLTPEATCLTSRVSARHDGAC